MRTLALHASALSDPEYVFFTKCLRDIADDDTASDDQDNISIPIREARAWFCGRYSRLSLATIDSILKLFSQNLAREDVMTGNEFFAALRLVTHAENGKPVDRSLAFIQVDPSPSVLTEQPNLPPLPPRKPSSSTSNHPPPPPPPRHIDRSISPSKRPSITPPIPPKPSQHITSTLIKQSLQARKIAQSLKKAEEQLDKETVLQVLKSSSVVTGAYPLAGAKVLGSSVVIGTNIHNQHQYPCTAAHHRSPSLSSSSDTSHRPQVPPLPKRRSAHPPSQQPSPPPSDSSLEQVALASHPEVTIKSSNPFTKPDDLPNHPLPAPPPTHPDRNPTFGYHQLSPSPKPPSPPPQLTTQNLEAFEAVYGSMAFQPISPFRTTPPPPKSDTLLNTTSQSRPIRSHSLSHHTPPPTTTTPTQQSPIPPPMRRTRHESAQLPTNASPSPSLSRRTSTRGAVYHRKSSLSLSSASSYHPHPSSPFSDTPPHPHRPTSGLSTSSTTATSTNNNNNTGSSNALGTNIQRTIDALHQIHGQLIQPTLDKARYKAEAGLLSKRGYLRTSSSSIRRADDNESESAPAAAEVADEEQASLTGHGIRPRVRGRWLDAEYVDGGVEDVDLELDLGLEPGLGLEMDGGWERERGRVVRPVDAGLDRAVCDPFPRGEWGG